MSGNLSRKAFYAVVLGSGLSACSPVIPDMRPSSLNSGNFPYPIAPYNPEPYRDITPLEEYFEPQILQPIEPQIQNNFGTQASTDPSRIELRTVDYNGVEPVGAILINIADKKLYLINGGGTAMEYPIATARAGVYEDYSNLDIGNLRENPTWTPTDAMVGATPTTADDPNNPLGEYAINLNRNGNDTLLRIHGTRDADRRSIGTAASAGCFRMLNEHVENLFYRVNRGASVKTYTQSGATPGLNYGGQSPSRMFTFKQ